MLPYILTIAVVSAYFLTESKKERTYPTLTVGVTFLAALLAVYFRGALVAYLSWINLPLFVSAWASGSIISRIIELPKTLSNLWNRVKHLLNIA